MLLAVYRSLLVAQLQQAAQYRVQALLWMLFAVIRPIIFLAAWAAVGGSGSGRVDMRIDESGRPWVLEVNANADISADAGLARMAKVAGMSYDDLILAIVDVALSKRGIDRTDRWARTLQLSGVG